MLVEAETPVSNAVAISSPATQVVLPAASMKTFQWNKPAAQTVRPAETAVVAPAAPAPTTSIFAAPTFVAAAVATASEKKAVPSKPKAWAVPAKATAAATLSPAAQQIFEAMKVEPTLAVSPAACATKQKPASWAAAVHSGSGSSVADDASLPDATGSEVTGETDELNEHQIAQVRPHVESDCDEMKLIHLRVSACSDKSRLILANPLLDTSATWLLCQRGSVHRDSPRCVSLSLEPHDPVFSSL
jgi:hypothetical protein